MEAAGVSPFLFVSQGRLFGPALLFSLFRTLLVLLLNRLPSLNFC